MTRSVVVIRHLAFEDLGAFETVFLESGLDVRYVEAGLDDLGRLDPGDDDIAVILGGPIGACDDRIYPFLNRSWDLRLGAPISVAHDQSTQVRTVAKGSRTFGSLPPPIKAVPTRLPRRC